MDTSQRVSRGFRRLAVLLAVLAFLAITFWKAPSSPNESVLLLGTIIMGAVGGLIVYGGVRLIGWVVGGFVAS